MIASYHLLQNQFYTLLLDKILIMINTKLIKKEILNENVHLEIPIGEKTTLTYYRPDNNVYMTGKAYCIEITVRLEVVDLNFKTIYYSVDFLTNYQVEMQKHEITIDLIGEIVANFKHLAHEEIKTNKTIIEKVDGTTTLPSIESDVPNNETSTSIFQKIQGLA